MKALQAVYDTRGPEPHSRIRCEAAELPAQVPAGMARVAVLAAPINPSDVLTITGEYGLLPPLPAIGGNEGVGRVLALGDGAGGLAEGDLVLLPVGIGTWRSHLDAPAKALVPLPHDVDPVQLSMLAVNPPTALLMLREFVDLQPGDWVIQNGANSAVGGYLVQLAKARGLNVVNVVRRASAIEAVQASGGEHVVVDAEDLPQRIKAIVGEAPVRLAVDCVGGASTEHLARCLADGATLVNYGAMSGERCAVSPRFLIFRDLRLRGFWLSRWFKESTPEARRAVFAELAARIADGTLSANVQATYGLEHVREAVAAAAEGARTGKIILEPNGPPRAAI